jgi:hypothetical protein
VCSLSVGTTLQALSFDGREEARTSTVHSPFPAVDLYAEKMATTGSSGSIDADEPTFHLFDLFPSNVHEPSKM